MHHDSSRSPVGTYAGQAPRFLPLLRVSVVAHGIFLFIAGGYLVLLQVLFNVYSEMSSKSASDLVTAMLLFSTATTLTALLVYVFVRMAIYERPERPILRFCRNLLSILRDKHVWALGIPAYFSLYGFLFVFSVLKANISVFQPFVWDETFDHWDRVLHFGYRPWELLQPVLGYPAVTYVLDVNYDIWFLMMAGFWLHFACFTRPGVARTRYLLSFFLLWMIGGGLFAVLLSSAGPVLLWRRQAWTYA
jgi:hypothetical protein